MEIKKMDNYSHSKQSREGLSQLRYSQEQCSLQRVKLPQHWLKKMPKIFLNVTPPTYT